MILDAKDFIAAIKTVRTLGQSSALEVDRTVDGRVTVSMGHPVGLKEAKDFIEDVMALGVRRFLDQQASEQAVAWTKTQEMRRRSAAYVPPVNDDIRF